MWLLSPDDPKRDAMKRIHARRSPRESTGQVHYGPDFWYHAHQAVGHTSGTDPKPKQRETASGPVSPIERISVWYMNNEWLASIIWGLFLTGAAATFAAWIVL